VTSRDFCYWLGGYFQINGPSENNNCPSLNSSQVAVIAEHLARVFRTELEPSAELRKLQESIGRGPITAKELERR
jgi:hypothetical protein